MRIGSSAPERLYKVTPLVLDRQRQIVDDRFVRTVAEADMLRSYSAASPPEIDGIVRFDRLALRHRGHGDLEAIGNWRPDQSRSPHGISSCAPALLC